MDEKPDWILSSLENTISPESLKAAGLTANDFSIRDADSYWEKDYVKNLFQGEDGAPDRDGFNAFYNLAASNLGNQSNAAVSFHGRAFDTYAGQEESAFGKRMLPQVLEVNPDIYDRDFGHTDFNRFSKPKVTIREKAIDNAENYGVLMQDGSRKKLDEATDLTSHVIFARNEDGSYAFDENGSPYMREVGEGEELKSFDQIYNSSADWWGFYGADYGPSQFVGTILGSPMKFVGQTIDSLAEFAKVFAEEEGDARGNIVDLENWGKGIDWGMTDKGMSSFWSFENIANLGLQAGWQIAGMVATGGATAALTGSTQVGSVTGKLFMSGLAAGEIGEIAREQGLSRQETGMLLFTTMGALYPIMALSEYAARGLGLADSSVAAKSAVAPLLNLPKGTLKQALKNRQGVRYLKSRIAEGTRQGLDKIGNLPGGQFLSSAAAESLEETTEEAVRKSIMGTYDFYNNLVGDSNSGVAQAMQGFLGTTPGNNFFGEWFSDFDVYRDLVEPLALSAAGGAIGGGLAGGALKTFQKKAPESYNTLAGWVAAGKADKLKKHINNFASRGLLNVGYLDATADNASSVNEQTREALIQSVEQMEQVFAQAGASGIYQQASKDILAQFPEDVQEFFIDRNIPPEERVGYTSLMEDIRDLAMEKSELMNSEATLNEQEAERLEQIDTELAELRTGKKNKQYVQQALLMTIQKAKKGGAQPQLENLAPLFGFESPDVADGFQLSSTDMQGLMESTKSDQSYLEGVERDDRAELVESSAEYDLETISGPEMNLEDVNFSEEKFNELTELKAQDLNSRIEALADPGKVQNEPPSPEDVAKAFDENPELIQVGLGDGSVNLSESDSKEFDKQNRRLGKYREIGIAKARRGDFGDTPISEAAIYDDGNPSESYKPFEILGDLQEKENVYEKLIKCLG